MVHTKLLNGVYITKKIMDTWHLKDFQAVGFAGCFMAESGCDPGAYNAAEKSGRFKGSSANGSGYGAGLAGWSNSWKRQIQKQFNNYRPIETWSLDQQIAIITKGCSESFINLLRNTKTAGQSTDIVLRGYENGTGGRGTKLRSQQSMKGYTWCKTSYLADGSRHTFRDGYIGALTSRISWANAILSKMGSVNLADLSGLGAEVSDGGFDGGGFGDTGGAGMGNSNAYPVHDEYKTYTGQGGDLFANSKDNAFQMASATSKQTMFSSKDQFASSHTRIYSTNDSCIVLDELKIPYNSNDPAIEYANQGITKKDVEKKSADTSTGKKDTSTGKKDTSTGKTDKKSNSTDKSNTNKNTKKSK